MVNGSSHIYIERRGKIVETEAAFVDDQHLLRIIDKIISRIGRRIDEASPMVDARLPDGSRVNAIIPPLAVSGPTLTIRKFRKDPFKMEDLLRFGSLTPKCAQFLEACVRGKLNILISGGTGSGKTTTLNVLSAAIPDDERIITVEDAAELQLRQQHVITLESRPANIEGKGLVQIRDLVRNTLRMRPDRIVVGEVRGPEAVDMLQAMNTGHDGSITTIHANTPRDALSRVETLVLTAGVELPLKAIREQIASAIDLVVQVSRLVDGTRRITYVTEVLRMESDVVTMQDIFRAKPIEDDSEIPAAGSSRLLGPLQCTGIIPRLHGQARRQRRAPAAGVLPDRAARGWLRLVRAAGVVKHRAASPRLRRSRSPRPAAGAATQPLRITQVDTSRLPLVAVTVQAPPASRRRARRRTRSSENGRPVSGLHISDPEQGSRDRRAPIDASRSMKGTPLAKALAAARSFSAAKRPNDQLSVLSFGNEVSAALPLTSDPDVDRRGLREVVVSPARRARPCTTACSTACRRSPTRVPDGAC